MNRRVFLATLAAVPVIGCQRRIETESRIFSRPEAGKIATIVIDMSGSFAQLMADGGAAWDFTTAIINKFFLNSIGTDDRLIISQISGTEPLLWEGKPLDLRSDFPSSAAFRDFLKSKSTDGSPIHSAVVKSVDYTLAVSDSATKLCLCVLSDMDDNGPNGAEAKTRALASLNAFGKRGGTVGLFYVGTPFIEPWKQTLHGSTVKEWTVQGQIVSRPTIPNWWEE